MEACKLEILYEFKKYEVFWHEIGRYWEKNLKNGKCFNNPFYSWIKIRRENMEYYVENRLQPLLLKITTNNNVKAANKILKRLRNVNDQGNYLGILSEMAIATSFVDALCSISFEPKINGKKLDLLGNFENIDFNVQIKRINPTVDEQKLEEFIRDLEDYIEENTSGVFVWALFKRELTPTIVNEVETFIKKSISDFKSSTHIDRKIYHFPDKRNRILELTITKSDSSFSRLEIPYEPVLHTNNGREELKFRNIIREAQCQLPDSYLNIIILTVLSAAHHKHNIESVILGNDGLFNNNEFVNVSGILYTSKWGDSIGEVKLFLNTNSQNPIPSKLESLLRNLRKNVYVPILG